MDSTGSSLGTSSENKVFFFFFNNVKSFYEKLEEIKEETLTKVLFSLYFKKYLIFISFEIIEN